MLVRSKSTWLRTAKNQKTTFCFAIMRDVAIIDASDIMLIMHELDLLIVYELDLLIVHELDLLIV